MAFLDNEWLIGCSTRAGSDEESTYWPLREGALYLVRQDVLRAWRALERWFSIYIWH